MILSKPQSAYNLNEEIESILLGHLNRYLDYSKYTPQQTAKFILELSDKYIHKKRDLHKIWEKPEMRLAYLVYFMPLNILRNIYILEQAKRVGFFDGIKNIHEFGSGSGASQAAFASIGLEKNFKFYFTEISHEAIETHKKLFPNEIPSWSQKVSTKNLSSGDLLLCSYSLNELDKTPQWLFDFKNIIIIEPSTRFEARKLLKLRQELIDQGYFIWAPCTHQNACPLLTHSKKDWCHGRMHTDMPKWWLDIEKHLPIKNSTITFSYLLASKRKPLSQTNIARITGDPLKQKGKTKQLVCRGEDREFLTWMSKNKNYFELPRGSLIELPSEINKVSDELRL